KLVKPGKEGDHNMIYVPYGDYDDPAINNIIKKNSNVDISLIICGVQSIGAAARAFNNGDVNSLVHVIIGEEKKYNNSRDYMQRLGSLISDTSFVSGNEYFKEKDGKKMHVKVYTRN
ncbi:MAG TPA: hypothetical protein PLC53_02200, partial [Bacilli bacterium]|nr:hypothetical protein [Bacilli bacterium]